MNIHTKKHLININRGKQYQMQEDRLTEIERSNRILFGQIEEIMFRKQYKY